MCEGIIYWFNMMAHQSLQITKWVTRQCGWWDEWPVNVDYEMGNNQFLSWDGEQSKWITRWGTVSDDHEIVEQSKWIMRWGTVKVDHEMGNSQWGSWDGGTVKVDHEMGNSQWRSWDSWTVKVNHEMGNSQSGSLRWWNSQSGS